MQTVPCCFKVLLDSLVKNWLLVSSYNINTYDVVTFFFDPEDLEVPDEYEVDVCDMNKNLKEWAVDTSVGFSCKHVIPLYRETLHKIVFSDIADISEEDMCEINWVLVKERKFYYTMNKDEDFFELDQFFVHRMKEDDVNFLYIMDCEVFNHGVEYGHGPARGNTYTMTEPDNDEYYRNDLCSETELSQEFLVNEIRKIEKRRKLLQNGGEDDIDAAPRATSRYCLSHLFEVIKCVRNCSRKTKLVSDIGFGDILQLDECIVPRAFAQWLADVCTFDDDDSIVIQSTVIMNPGSVKDTFAIPCGELPIAIEDEDGKLAFIAQFALTDVPPIKYFGRMAMSDDLSDDVFKRCFMAVTLGSFLCPTSSTKPSTKYLGALVDVDNIKFLNWCKLVHDWLVCYINKYKKDKMKANKMSLTLGGCIYHIAVRYLDFVEFGSIMLLATLPRIRVWKGDLIKHFSNMVIVRTGSYNSYHKSSEVVCLGERMNRDVTLSPEIEFMGERPARITSISQEVQILGERSFNNVCNDMSNKTDDLYNAGLSLGNKSVSSGKENLRPKRVVNRSSYLCSPFDINNTSRIEPHEMKLYETITTLCDDPNYQNKWVVNMNNCRCTLKQLGCSMKQGGWVEAWVINAICRKLFKDKHPRQSQKHFFFHTSSLNFPSLYDRHWFLFVVDMKARKFLFMDSLFGEHSDLHQEVDDKIITNFTRTWEECNLKEIHFETFGKLYPNLPKQKTPNDCEIFLIKYMEWYCTRNPKACSFSAKDIPEFRVKLAVDTLFNDYNSAIPEMDLISTFDLE
ncbi:hypothetical protein ACQ4PT_018107 [Festuca glaucescens]